MFIGRRPDDSIYGAWTTQQLHDTDHPKLEEVANDLPELVAFLAPKPPPGFRNVDDLARTVKTIALCIAEVGGLSVPQMRALFKQKWDGLA